MINLRKTHFLTPKAKLLGMQITGGGYTLGPGFMQGWQDVAIPTTIKEL